MLFKPQNRPTRRLDPRTSGHLVQPEGRLAHAQWGPAVGPPGSPRRKKSFFPKLFLDHFGCSNKCFSAVLSPWWRVLGHGKSPKCLENGPFWDQKWVKNGSKTRFSKSDPGPFGVLKQVFLARFEPVLTECSPFHHMYEPLCALRMYLRAVWWSHLDLGGYILLHPSPLKFS